MQMRENEALRTTAELTALTREHRCRLVFFTPHDPKELRKQGIIPPGSLCLSYQTSGDDLHTSLRFQLGLKPISVGTATKPLFKNTVCNHPGS